MAVGESLEWGLGDLETRVLKDKEPWGLAAQSPPGLVTPIGQSLSPQNTPGLSDRPGFLKGLGCASEHPPWLL